jgi:hypothetical protein
LANLFAEMIAMSSEIQAVLTDLNARVTQLEREKTSPRGRTNLAGAARYLGISDETLRQQHLRGEGPKRTRMGRHWSYSYADLDAHAQGPTDTAA